jgi:hypothetical protein
MRISGMADETLDMPDERPPDEHGLAPLWVVWILEALSVDRQKALTLDCDDAVRLMTSSIKTRLIDERLVDTHHA